MMNKENKNILIVLVGPTAVGKTNVAIHLSQALGAEIFSADSRQLYKELNIGTAKPSKEELQAIPHHFISSQHVYDSYTVKQYEEDLESALNAYYDKNNIAILTGGTGLYVKAALYGLDHIPDISPVIVSQLQHQVENGDYAALEKELKETDPKTYAEIDIKNSRRVIRALSVIRQTGKPFSTFKKGKKHNRNFKAIKILLERDRAELYQRINTRVDHMMDSGLLAEVKALERYYDLPSLRTVGYQELIRYIRNEIDYQEAIRLIKRNTRRYAKRQLTWFKNQDEWNSFHPDDITGILAFIEANS